MQQREPSLMLTSSKSTIFFTELTPTVMNTNTNNTTNLLFVEVNGRLMPKVGPVLIGYQVPTTGSQ